MSAGKISHNETGKNIICLQGGRVGRLFFGSFKFQANPKKCCLMAP